MTAIEKFREYVEKSGDIPEIGEFEQYDELFEEALREDRNATRQFLWLLLESKQRWKRTAIKYLADERFDRHLTDSEYYSLEKYITDGDRTFRSGLGQLLGSTYRWPNPLLMQLIIHEKETFRAALISYLLGAAGLNPIESLQYAHRLAKHPGLVTEDMIIDAIREAKVKNPKIWEPK